MNDSLPLISDELDLLESLVPLAGARLVELGCGAARMARSLLERHPEAELTGLEVDERQHAKNLAVPQPRLRFLQAGAQAIPLPDAAFDGALIVSEPVYDGALNGLVRLFNDEGEVRAAAQRALDEALRTGPWEAWAERRFGTPVQFRDFADFEARMMRPTFADHRIDDAKLAQVRARFEPLAGPEGASFTRPMHVRLLRRRG